ncbi:MAG: dihydrolipoyl dehydrogenase [Acidobacteriota bacterium]
MESKSYDVIVIGSGPGGYVTAIRAAQLNFNTAIVERDKLGGICLNWGCIPTKALLSNARIYNEVKRLDQWGISASDIQFDMKKIIARSRSVAETLEKGVGLLMKKNKIEVIKGSASFLNESELSIADANGEETQRLSAKHLIVATGARARNVPGIEVDGRKVLTYKHALVLDHIPESMIVIGAGAIGVEFAYFYNSFGCKVTMVEMMDQLLPVEDHEIAKELGKSFKKKGIEVLLETKVAGVKKDKEGVTVSVKGPKGKQDLKADMALNAVGVVGNIEDLNLDKIGVKTEKNHIVVDRWYRTKVEGVYAIGDVIGAPWLAHVASHEGITCVEKIAGVDRQAVDYQTVPGCTYCQPQVASVGLTEKKAREEGYKIKVGKFPFQVLGKARASLAAEGFVKLIFDEEYGELLGAHIIGEEATEMIAELVTAKALETTYLELLKTMHAHPTLSEAVGEAAGMAYGEQIHL